MVNTIDSFRGEYGFLSNFFNSPIRMSFNWAKNIEFIVQSGEAAFSAAKLSYSEFSIETRLYWAYCIANTEPAGAKKIGRNIKLNVSEWDNNSYAVMTEIQRLKYTQNTELADLLVATKDAILVEGNTWGDRIWGQVNGVGENRLGQILMSLRSELTT